MEKEAKQIIVIRKDLNMRKGKMISQGAHASMAVFFNLIKSQNGVKQNDETSFSYSFSSDSKAIFNFINYRFKKITVYVNSLEEMLELERKAKEAKLLSALITDAGLTEFNGVPTITALAIGPAFNDELDPITKDLPLL
jgi:PTH2 family peptidyl-tRNA hydrolase